MLLFSQLYFPLEREVKGTINSVRIFYSNEVKEFSDHKKVELGRMTTASRNGPISLKLIWLVCFKLI